MTLTVCQYLDYTVNSTDANSHLSNFKTVDVVWKQRMKMAVILYIYRYLFRRWLYNCTSY